MTFRFEISGKLEKILAKLSRKNKTLAIAVNKKIKQIINSDISFINHFKNLRAPMNYLKRVHIGGFILTFQVKNNIIFFENFGHHDKAY